MRPIHVAPWGIAILFGLGAIVSVLGAVDVGQGPRSEAPPISQVAPQPGNLYSELRAGHNSSKSDMFELEEDGGTVAAPEPPMFEAGINSSSGVMSSIVLQERNWDVTKTNCNVMGNIALPETKRIKVQFAKPVGMKVLISSDDPATWFQPDLNSAPTTVIPAFLACGPKMFFDLGGRVTFRTDGDSPTKTPTSCGLTQGRVYQIAFSDVENQPVGFHVNATIEIAAEDEATRDFISENMIPISFTKEDFENVILCRSVVKIFYLRKHSDSDDVDVGVSTHMQWPTGTMDPIQETKQRGPILAIVRLGLGQIFSASLAAPTFPVRFSPAEAAFIFSMSTFR